MNNIHAKQTEMKNTFISVRETIDLIFESLSKEIDKQTKDNHVTDTMNLRFFKNQTCLAKDGYDLENIKIDRESQPSYQDFKKATISYLSGKTNPLLDKYGFSRKRTLDNLQMMGFNIPYEMILMAQSFIPNNDCWYDETNYREFLPFEYTVLAKECERLKSEVFKPTADHASTAELHARIAELEKQLTEQTDELHPRTANNASKIILAMAELLKWDLSKPYADDTNGKIREILEKQQNSLSKDTIADWFKQAFDAGK